MLYLVDLAMVYRSFPRTEAVLERRRLPGGATPILESLLQTPWEPSKLIHR